MKITRLTIFSFLLFFALLLEACSPQLSPPTQQPAGLVNTLAAQTVAAQLTSAAQDLSATPGPPEATATLTQAPTLLPSSTPIPSNTPIPSATTTPPGPPTVPPVSQSCNQAEFINDVSIPDDTLMAPGATFTKTWRVKNSGDCDWTTDYALIFVSGDDMKGQTTKLPKAVRAGGTIDISVEMVAPTVAGEYKGNWMMTDGNNAFGMGPQRNKMLWVKIEVSAPAEGMALDFATSYCAASWSSGAGSLPCPGKSGDANGFVLYMDQAKLERGKENEPMIWANPQDVKNGYISGVFPPITIEAGDEFVSEVGCLADHPECNVTFELTYQLPGGSPKSLGEWNETSDGETTVIQVDLTSLAGKQVQLILTVHANGSPNQDAAFWLVPQIQR